MWERGWRESIWGQLEQPWDVIVVGGGITGAGILREAARLGLRALLVEQRDFAWGTSSRSSKLVHGGLRYLQQGQVGLIQDSVRERDRLLVEAPGLVEPLGFLIALYKGERPGRWTYTAGLMLYDFLAGQRQYDHYSREDFLLLAPHVARAGLTGGLRYQDAQTDDTRLVLRVLREAVSEGGTALNYARVEGLLREAEEVVGVRLHDVESGCEAEVRARVVINATGAWADHLRGEVGAQRAIRPLRGSHLIFPAWRLPVAQAIAITHPEDRRFLFAFPWEGATVVGTTDLDHKPSLNEEPRITSEEVEYLMRAIQVRFPELG
nr:glycerol-3-phosphate dehydrogenase/oxidase [Ardenticatenales bacterium]